MAQYIKRKGLPEDFTLVCTSDWHIGSKAFHEEAARDILKRVADEDNTYLVHGGDLIEGKKVDSPHFDPKTLVDGQTLIESQLEFAQELVKEYDVSKKWLAQTMGNHELYLTRDVDVLWQMFCKPLGIPRGGYQNWIDLDYFRIHSFHGRAYMPRGAKDPIQRDANQRAWLVNQLAPLAGDCLVHLLGHTHAMLTQEPIEQYALLSKQGGVRARYFRQPTQVVKTRNPTSGKEDHREFIPPQSRWYANTGTLRRSGGFGYVDYSEVAGYAPSPIGYVELLVREGQPVEMRKVVI